MSSRMRYSTILAVLLLVCRSHESLFGGILVDTSWDEIAYYSPTLNQTSVNCPPQPQAKLSHTLAPGTDAFVPVCNPHLCSNPTCFYWESDSRVVKIYNSTGTFHYSFGNGYDIEDGAYFQCYDDGKPECQSGDLQIRLSVKPVFWSPFAVVQWAEGKHVSIIVLIHILNTNRTTTDTSPLLRHPPWNPMLSQTEPLHLAQR